VCLNQLSCVPPGDEGIVKNSSGSPVLFPGTAIRGGKLRVTVLDNDSPLAPDQAAQGYFPATTTLAPLSTGAFGSCADLDFELL
jgi:hypothetical protein